MTENRPLPENENIYETPCPILYAMEIIGKKWKLPILWYGWGSGRRFPLIPGSRADTC